MAVHSVKMNFLSRADGSTLYTLGNTVVVASVTGPAFSRPATRLHNRCSVEVVFTPRNGQAMCMERGLEGVISEAVQQVLSAHLHPRAAVAVNIQELQSEGPHQCLSASLNAVCLALVDAGVQLSSLFTAVSAALTHNGVVIVEPGSVDAQESRAQITFVMGCEDLGVLACHQEGKLSVLEYNTCLRSCQEAAKQVFVMYREHLQRKYGEEEPQHQRQEDQAPV